MDSKFASELRLRRPLTNSDYLWEDDGESVQEIVDQMSERIMSDLSSDVFFFRSDKKKMKARFKLAK